MKTLSELHHCCSEHLVQSSVLCKESNRLQEQSTSLPLMASRALSFPETSPPMLHRIL